MSKEYIFKKDGKTELVPIERWAWAVEYKDGRTLDQFAADGIFHQIGEVDQENVKMFVLYKPGETGGAICIMVEPGMKLIHLYRNIKPWWSEKFIRVYIFGYKLGNKEHYNFILPDDTIVQSTNRNIDLMDFNLK